MGFIEVQSGGGEVFARHSSSLMYTFRRTALDMPSLKRNHTSLLPTAFPIRRLGHLSPTERKTGFECLFGKRSSVGDLVPPSGENRFEGG